jgi:hypothetical protein
LARNPLLDGRERLRLRAAVILDRRADDAAGIGDEIGHADDTVSVHPSLGRLGGRDVRALDDQLGLERAHVVGGERVGPRGGNPDLARDPDQRLAGDRPAAGEVGQRAPGPLVGHQGVDRQPGGVVDRAPAVGGGDQPGATRGQESRRVLAHRAEAFDRHPRPGEGDPGLGRRDLGRDGDAPAGGADLVERDAAEHAREADGPIDLVLDPGHAALVGAHVGARNVFGERADRAREGADQALLVRRRPAGVGDDAGLAPAVWQAGRRVLHGHGPGEPGDLFERDVAGHAHPADGRSARDVVDDHDGLQPDPRVVDPHDLVRPELVTHPAAAAQVHSAVGSARLGQKVGPSVLHPARLVVVGADRALLAVGDRHHPRCRYAAGQEIAHGRSGAKIPQPEVVLAGTALVSMALDEQEGARVRVQPDRVLVEDGHIRWANVVGVVVEVNVGQPRDRDEFLGRRW